MLLSTLCFLNVPQRKIGLRMFSVLRAMLRNALEVDVWQLKFSEKSQRFQHCYAEFFPLIVLKSSFCKKSLKRRQSHTDWHRQMFRKIFYWIWNGMTDICDMEICCLFILSARFWLFFLFLRLVNDESVEIWCSSNTVTTWAGWNRLEKLDKANNIVKWSNYLTLSTKNFP